MVCTRSQAQEAVSFWGGKTCRSCVWQLLYGGLGVCPPGKFGILVTLRSFLGQFCKRYTNHLYTAALGILKEWHNWTLHEGSPVLDSTDVPSSAPKYSMPEVHLKGSPSTGELLSVLTQPIPEVLLQSSVRMFVSFVATMCMRHTCALIYGNLRCMYEY